MPQLRVKNGPAQGKIYDLKKDVIQLGRESEIQVLDTSASRQHAEVFAIGDMYFLRDLGSRNGTFLNDEHLEKDGQALLRVGDLIRIGSTQIVFEEPAPPREDEPQFTTGEEEIAANVELHLDPAQIGSAEPKTAEASIHFSVLYDMSKAISSAFDVKGLMLKVCDISLEATPADGAFIFVREEGKLIPVAHRRRGEHHTSVQVSSSIIKRSIQHNRSVLVSDALRDKRFSGSSSIVMSGIRSVICAPLVAHDRITGVLYLHSSAIDRIFNDEHLRLVTAIALQAAVAIEAMRSREEARRQLISVFRTLMTAHEEASSAAANKGHSDRVYACAQAMCKTLDLPAVEAHTIELAALLHEVGQLGMPEGAFGREDARFACAALGAQMLRRIDGFEEVAIAVENHLERLDGTGGPRRLIGHQIPRPARVIAIADEFSRRYAGAIAAKAKPADAVKQALMSLNEECGEKFDADLFNGLVLALRSGSLKLA